MCTQKFGLRCSNCGELKNNVIYGTVDTPICSDCWVNKNNFMMEGWQCPNCKTVYAPFVMQCECSKIVHSGSGDKITFYIGDNTVDIQYSVDKDIMDD